MKIDEDGRMNNSKRSGMISVSVSFLRPLNKGWEDPGL